MYIYVCNLNTYPYTDKCSSHTSSKSLLLAADENPQLSTIQRTSDCVMPNSNGLLYNIANAPKAWGTSQKREQTDCKKQRTENPFGMYREETIIYCHYHCYFCY